MEYDLIVSMCCKLGSAIWSVLLSQDYVCCVAVLDDARERNLHKRVKGGA